MLHLVRHELDSCQKIVKKWYLYSSYYGCMQVPENVTYEVAQQPSGTSIIFVHGEGKLSKRFLVPSEEVPQFMESLQFPQNTSSSQPRRDQPVNI